MIIKASTFGNLKMWSDSKFWTVSRSFSWSLSKYWSDSWSYSNFRYWSKNWSGSWSDSTNWRANI